MPSFSLRSFEASYTEKGIQIPFMPMPKRLAWDAYCSAPPIPTISMRPPRLTRDQEARRPRAPLVAIKREVHVEFVIDNDLEDMKPPIKIEFDPRQIRAGVAALSIRPPQSSASTSSGEAAAAAPGPSRCEHRTKALCRIPAQSLGPADPPRGRGWPKGSKSRPRIVFGITTLPERATKIEAEKSLTEMSSWKEV